LYLPPGAKIQMLDLPGIIEGAKDGKGRGRQVISTARTCNLILIVLDCLKPLTHKKVQCGALQHGFTGCLLDVDVHGDHVALCFFSKMLFLNAWFLFLNA
jgi:hypothetical protein